MTPEDIEQIEALKAQVLAAYEAHRATRRGTPKAQRLTAQLLEEAWERLFEILMEIKRDD